MEIQTWRDLCKNFKAGCKKKTAWSFKFRTENYRFVAKTLDSDIFLRLSMTLFENQNILANLKLIKYFLKRKFFLRVWERGASFWIDNLNKINLHSPLLTFFHLIYFKPTFFFPSIVCLNVLLSSIQNKWVFFLHLRPLRISKEILHLN